MEIVREIATHFWLQKQRLIKCVLEYIECASNCCDRQYILIGNDYFFSLDQHKSSVLRITSIVNIFELEPKFVSPNPSDPQISQAFIQQGHDLCQTPQVYFSLKTPIHLKVTVTVQLYNNRVLSNRILNLMFYVKSLDF